MVSEASTSSQTMQHNEGTQLVQQGCSWAPIGWVWDRGPGVGPLLASVFNSPPRVKNFSSPPR
eukprot:6817091-Karenia_brevis.AAC.1